MRSCKGVRVPRHGARLLSRYGIRGEIFAPLALRILPHLASITRTRNKAARIACNNQDANSQQPNQLSINFHAAALLRVIRRVHIVLALRFVISTFVRKIRKYLVADNRGVRNTLVRPSREKYAGVPVSRVLTFSPTPTLSPSFLCV